MKVKLLSGRIANLRYAWDELMDSNGQETQRPAAGNRVCPRPHQRVAQQSREEMVPFEFQRKERMQENQRRLQELLLHQVCFTRSHVDCVSVH